MSTYCEVCDLDVRGPKASFDRHVNGKKHQAKFKATGRKVTTSDRSPEKKSKARAKGGADTRRNARGASKRTKREEGSGEEAESNYCEVCDITISIKNNSRAWENHLNGKKHKAKMNTEGMGGGAKKSRDKEVVENYCEVCDVRAFGEYEWERHLQGKKHKASMARADMDESEETHYCGICNARIVGASKWAGHLKSNSHQAKLEALSKYCDVCDINVLGKPQWAAHLKGKKHLRKAGGTVEPGGTSNFCEACKINVSGGDAMWDRHLTGRKHLKIMKDLTRND